MGAPNTFIRWFCERLRAAGVRFAITSGQACVYYGIQQTTKDSDWIIEPADLTTLRTMLADAVSSGIVRVSYRPICAAPLEQEFLGNGWTSHVVIADADSDEHHLDFFGKAPRVTKLEHDPINQNYAARHVVAQMKKTDREKDWPTVFALGRQALACGDVRGILHGQDADWLIQAWKSVPEDNRPELIGQRPSLGLIDSQPGRLRRALAIEKQIWTTVNRERYTAYQRSWKTCFRQWRREANFNWPPDASFLHQHQVLLAAARRYGLPEAPLDSSARQAALATARATAAEIFAA